MQSFILISTTTENKTDAESIAAVLLAKRLAACVQIIGPIQSRYWWENAIQQSDEFLCLIKTSSDLYQKVEEAILSVHPYDVPEIVALPIIEGSSSYLSWITAVTQQ